MEGGAGVGAGGIAGDPHHPADPGGPQGHPHPLQHIPLGAPPRARHGSRQQLGGADCRDYTENGGNGPENKVFDNIRGNSKGEEGGYLRNGSNGGVEDYSKNGASKDANSSEGQGEYKKNGDGEAGEDEEEEDDRPPPQLQPQQLPRIGQHILPFGIQRKPIRQAQVSRNEANCNF